MHVKHLKL